MRIISKRARGKLLLKTERKDFSLHFKADFRTGVESLRVTPRLPMTFNGNTTRNSLFSLSFFPLERAPSLDLFRTLKISFSAGPPLCAGRPNGSYSGARSLIACSLFCSGYYYSYLCWPLRNSLRETRFLLRGSISRGWWWWWWRSLIGCSWRTTARGRGGEKPLSFVRPQGGVTISKFSSPRTTSL